MCDSAQAFFGRRRSLILEREQDARQLLTASNEGMPGTAEGIDKDDHHQLGQVERAKEKIGEKPEDKPAH